MSDYFFGCTVAEAAESQPFRYDGILFYPSSCDILSVSGISSLNIAGYIYKWEFVSYSDSEKKYYFRRVFQSPYGDPEYSINYISLESSFRCVPVYSELKGPSDEHPYGSFTYGVYYPYVDVDGVSKTGYYAAGPVELAFSSQEQYDHALACVLGNSSDFDDSGTGEGDSSGTGEGESSGTGESESGSDTSWLGSIGDWFSSLISKLGEWFSSILSSLSDIGAWFSSLISKLGEWFSNSISKIVEFKDGVLAWFGGFFSALGEFFIGLLLPSEGYFTEKNNALLALLEGKVKYSNITNSFTTFKNLTSVVPENITCTLYGKTFTIIDWSSIIEVRPTIYFWVRGFYYPLFLIYQYNQIYKLIRGTTYTDGSGFGGGSGPALPPGNPNIRV